ncbi:phage tail protein [Brevibacillus fluminis]|uniref:Phage tail protein n=1 Tax=Brevibacillus fluminis TaxID=511487 RepID=A0A3M8CUQ9_9BACL|nr:tail fiber protein [Brevibacillus fluminis]RNB79530.1 phage tail protein [Brevibacillus fluminis]
MGEPFIGEIRMFSSNVVQKGWALCNGQLLSINQNQALFSLLGTTYGGNGMTTFALPDLRGRVPMHWGSGSAGQIILGEAGGEVAHTLTTQEMPVHTHQVKASSASANGITPSNNVWAAQENCYSPATNPLPYPLAQMHSAAVSTVGGSQAHLNMQPFLTINFIIALQGAFPSRP